MYARAFIEDFERPNASVIAVSEAPAITAFRNASSASGVQGFPLGIFSRRPQSIRARAEPGQFKWICQEQAWKTASFRNRAGRAIKFSRYVSQHTGFYRGQ